MCLCLERDIVGVKKDTGEMVLLASEADLDEDLSIPVSTLKRFPHFRIITNLTDAHVYVMKKKLLDKLNDLHVQEDS
jgi:translation initiation factor eIF-2B subunit gamma